MSDTAGKVKRSQREPHGSWGDEWDAIADVVVVGAGVAGLAAALAAARQGRSVVVLEAAPHPGGTTAKSSGVMWIPNNPVMTAAGMVDEREAALRFMARGAHPTRFAPEQPRFGLDEPAFALLETLYDHGPRVFTELASLGAIPYDDTLDPAFPDYYAPFPEDERPVGRAIAMRMPAGHRPGVDATGGQLLIDAILDSCTRAGVDVRLETRVVHLITDTTHAIVGVEARRASSTQLVGARRGVVFATGGFLHDEQLTTAFLRGPVLGGAAAPTARGDFVRIGMEAGAALGTMAHAWWSEVVVESALRDRRTPRDCVYPFGDSMLIVNRFGERVMNEKMAYNDRGQVHHVWDPGRLEYVNFLLFMIFDDTVLNDDRPTNRPRWPVPLPDEGRENLLSAPSLAELAEVVDARLAEIGPQIGSVRLAPTFSQQLGDTIRRFSTMAIEGVDHDFGRGQSPLEKAWAGPVRPGLPNPTMRPFDDTGPYHCILLGPGALDTKGGPVIDAASRVVDVQGDVIPRLFAAGNCAAAPTGQAYYGPGGTIGPALTFGFLAGESASDEVERIPQL